jgi:hypothetical protein
LDRAGNKSENVNVTFTPLEPAFSKVAKALTVKPAFGALMIDWENELQQNITVFVDFSYSDNGTQRSLRQAYSSKASVERYFIKNLNLPESEAIDVKITVEDLYGNQSETIDKGQLHPLIDEELDKSKFVIPIPGTKMGDAIMGYGDSGVGRTAHIFDGFIDYVSPLGIVDNWAYFGFVHVVNGVNVNTKPWNILVDLGDYYELSRIITHQWWCNKNPQDMKPTDLGNFYGQYNVGKYNIYYWDGDDNAQVGEWKLITNVVIPQVDPNLAIIDIVKKCVAGDEALMYPNDPAYTPATRYFRYQAMSGLSDNYTGIGEVLSEITLYGRKARTKN